MQKRDIDTIGLIGDICGQETLLTYDPYDIWKTNIGFKIKDIFNAHKILGMLPAAVITLFDLYVNNDRRIGYRRQEYPIVRALATSCLIAAYKSTNDGKFLEFARKHIDWLLANHCHGFEGLGWGLGFHYAVDNRIVYDANTPFATMTPYVLNALLDYRNATDTNTYDEELYSILVFFDRDIKVMHDDRGAIATSYTPFRDRVVINSCSYTMASLAALRQFWSTSDVDRLLTKIGGLYEFIRQQQNSDGSWFYAIGDKSFIDCFHSCIVLKNLMSVRSHIELHDIDNVIERGADYLQKKLYDENDHLYHRFSVKNKPSIIKYDLYDNAEVASLMILMDELGAAGKLIHQIDQSFRRKNEIYSQITVTGSLRNLNMLRWAVLPYLYARSRMLPDQESIS